MYRPFLVGQKQLPEIVEGKSTLKERNWALNILTTSNAEAYLLELPQEVGPTQKEFEIRKEASYIISVKNPKINVPGFAAFSSARKPEYPSRLMEIFGDRRWIDIENSELLDYENTQLLLIGARKKDVEEVLGINIDEEKETQKVQIYLKN
jgi:hypothetical protein